MKNHLLALAAISGLVLSASVAGAGPVVNAPDKAKVGHKHVHKVSLRHKHRHCHIVITLGHAKKRCHTHRHNKVVHHGAAYH